MNRLQEMENMRKNLKPCPFCGGKADFMLTNYISVYCTECESSTAMTFHTNHAFKRWDRREESE